MRGALVAGVLALGMLLGCQSGAAPSSSSSAGSTTEARRSSGGSGGSAPADRPTSTTSFAQADQPPGVVNTGDDFRAIVESFVAYMEWLAAHPDPDLVSEVAEEGSRAWQQNVDVIGGLAEAGTRFDGVRPAYVTEVRIDRRPDESSVQLYVVVVNPAYEILDAAGAAVEAHPESPPRSAIWGLVRDPNGRWRLRELATLGEVPS